MAHFADGETKATAGCAFDKLIARGGEEYQRKRHLPRILPVAAEFLEAATEADRRALLARIARALRHERNRGRAGHWTYDPNRHIALAQAYAGERKLLLNAGQNCKKY